MGCFIFRSKRLIILFNILLLPSLMIPCYANPTGHLHRIGGSYSLTIDGSFKWHEPLNSQEGIDTDTWYSQMTQLNANAFYFFVCDPYVTNNPSSSWSTPLSDQPPEKDLLNILQKLYNEKATNFKVWLLFPSPYNLATSGDYNYNNANCYIDPAKYINNPNLPAGNTFTHAQTYYWTWAYQTLSNILVQNPNFAQYIGGVAIDDSYTTPGNTTFDTITQTWSLSPDFLFNFEGGIRTAINNYNPQQQVPFLATFYMKDFVHYTETGNSNPQYSDQTSALTQNQFQVPECVDASGNPISGCTQDWGYNYFINKFYPNYIASSYGQLYQGIAFMMNEHHRWNTFPDLKNQMVYSDNAIALMLKYENFSGTFTVSPMVNTESAIISDTWDTQGSIHPNAINYLPSYCSYDVNFNDSNWGQALDLAYWPTKFMTMNQLIVYYYPDQSTWKNFSSTASSSYPSCVSAVLKRL